MKKHQTLDFVQGRVKTLSISNEASPKKLVLMSIIDAEDDAVEQLGNALVDGGFSEEYQFIISADPVQTVGPLELIEQLKHIYNVSEDADPNNTGLTRTDVFRRLHRHVGKSLEAILEHVKITNENMRILTEEVEKIAGKTIILSRTTADEDIANSITVLDKDAPKEGQVW